MEETRRQEIMEEEAQAVRAKTEVRKYISGFMNMAVVKCAIDLGIAEAIEKHGGPMTLSELSSTLKCEPSSLYRLMRFLVCQRVFKEKPTSQDSIGFEKTPISRCLLRDGENSMAASVLLQTSPGMLASWFNLSAGILANGTPPFKAVHGKDEWGLAEADESHCKLFKEAMACGARSTVPAIIEGCPEVFDGLESLVDVGGGNGTALRLLVKAFPWIRGVNFDLPHAVAAAEKFPGIEHVGGNMFDTVPKADTILLMRVLHDWGDEDCIKILKNCREAVPKDKGKVIIVEIIIEEDNEAEEDRLKSVKLMVDMIMMARTDSGKERTLKELGHLLGQAGFKSYNVKPINAVQSVIEAYP